MWIGRTVFGVLFPAVPDADHVAEEPHGQVGIAGGLVFEEDVDADVAAVGFGGEEEVGFGEAEVGVDEGAGFEFKSAPVDAGGDLRGRRSMRKAAAAAGLERPARKRRSWAWKVSSSGMGVRGG